MTPTILSALAAAEAQIRTAAGTLDITRQADSERFRLLLEAAAQLAHARQALDEMAAAPIPPGLREPARFPPRLRLIEGGAA